MSNIALTKAPRVGKGYAHLSRVQLMQLGNWMQANKDILWKTAEEICPKAASELGFPVPLTTLNQFRRDLGFSPRAAAKKLSVSKNAGQHLFTIAKSLASLHEQLGVRVPAELADLVLESE